MALTYFDQKRILYYFHRLKGNYPPVSVILDPSNLCNHSCPHCYYKKYKKKVPIKMNYPLLNNIIKQLIDFKVKSILISGGGEPLTNNFLPHFIKKYSNKIDMALTTNGTLLDKNNIPTIVKHLKYIRISVDAGDRETYKKIHGKDDFDKVINNIKMLVKEKKKQKSDIIIGTTFLVTKDNYNKIVNYVKNMNFAGVDYCYIRPDYILKLSENKYEELKFSLGVLDMTKQKYKNKYGLDIFLNERRINEVIENKKSFKKCIVAFLMCQITADGKVYICCQFRGHKNFEIGDLKKQKFKDIWLNKKHKQIIKNINLKKCPACRNRFYDELYEDVFEKNTLMNFL